MKIERKWKENVPWPVIDKLSNMNVTVTPIVIDAFGTVTKGFAQGLEIRGQVETMKTTVLLKSDRILRRVHET